MPFSIASFGVHISFSHSSFVRTFMLPMPFLFTSLFLKTFFCSFVLHFQKQSFLHCCRFVYDSSESLIWHYSYVVLSNIINLLLLLIISHCFNSHEIWSLFLFQPNIFFESSQTGTKAQSSFPFLIFYCLFSSLLLLILSYKNNGFESPFFF